MLGGKSHVVIAAKQRLHVWTMNGPERSEIPIDRHVTAMSAWGSLLAFSSGEDLLVADLERF